MVTTTPTTHTGGTDCPACYAERTAIGLGPLPVITCYAPDAQVLRPTTTEETDK